jgi:hypothetical protein
MALLLTLACAALGLVWWVDQHYRTWKVKRALAEAECERVGHSVKRVYAYDDPRFPVDRCQRCPWQTPVRFPCPHCGVDIKPKGHHGSGS